MELPKLIILLCFIYISDGSHHHGHTIPVEGYESELQNLGQHVEIPETPVKVIKITKTIAVKVPVPYPVKVIQKVPYPVHVAKPYPVPVPQIVHVPYGHKHSSDEHSSHQGNAQENSYQVQESPSHELSDGQSYSAPAQENSYSGGGSSGHNTGSFAEEYPSEVSYGGAGGSSYDAPSQSYYGTGNQDTGNSFESQSYDRAIQDYLQKVQPSSGGHGAASAGGYYH